MASLRNLTDDYLNIVTGLRAENADFYLSEAYRRNPQLVAGYKAQHAVMADLLEGDASVYEYSFGGTPAFGIRPQKPLSRGSITISSKDPHPGNSPPDIDFGALSHPLDMKIAILGFKYARRVMNSPEMMSLRPVEMSPGPNVVSDADIEKALRGGVLVPSNAHPIGTAAMMPRELGGVVSPQLKVYGISRLRVVDASVFPMLPSAGTQCTTYAVAEKAADLIKST
jgi:choline dehydrogenase-like flavoprotein